MKIKKCNVNGCGGKYFCKGYCKKHYERLRVYGRLEKEIQQDTCQVENCNEPYFAKGYCRTHYYRMRNRGATDIHPKFIKKSCSVEGCNNRYFAKGYCGSHLRKIRLYGTTDSPLRIKKLCSVEGCNKPHEGKGLCVMHLYRFKKHGTVELEPRFGPVPKRTLNGSGYFIFRDRKIKKIRYEHIVIAEKALGKPLPKGAEVHHVDGNRANNDPRNLVICPNRAYHSLIEARTRAYNKRHVHITKTEEE